MIEDGVSSPGSGLLEDYQDPGTPPGTLTPPSGESGPARVVVASYAADAIEVRELTDHELLDTLRSDGRVHWVHVVGLADVEVSLFLGKDFVLTLQPGGDDLFAPIRHRLVKGRARLRQGYLGFWGVTIVGIVTMLWLFRRKGWL